MGFLREHWKYIVALLIGGVVGFYIGSQCSIETTKEIPVAKTEVEYKDRTEISYIPKTSKDDSDVEVTKALPKVSVSVNGKVAEMPLVQGETQKFQNGKLVMEQSSALTVDVSAQVATQIEQGINNAFKAQQRKPQYRIGLEGGVISAGSAVNTDGNLRISRQSEAFDIDVRANQSKQSISATWWFK